MRKVITTLILVLLLGGVQALAQNHSVSTSTLFGLEYGYEIGVSDGSSVVLRAGLPNRFIWHTFLADNSVFFHGEGLLAYGVTVEPRWYLKPGRRAVARRAEGGISGNYFAVRVQGTLGLPAYPTGEVCVVPMYGMRRAWSRHWFGEFSVGGGVSYHTLWGGEFDFKPHLQYRVGYSF